MAEDDRERALIVARCEKEGITVKDWREGGEDGLTADLGRYRVVEENDDQGFYADDEGTLTANVVGAAEYRNERVMFTFTPDEQDPGSGPEVDDLTVVDPV